MSRDITSSQVITNHHIDIAVYDSFAVEWARDIVKGHTTPYYFFRFDDDEYILIFADDMVTENGFDCSAHDCTCLVLFREDTTITDHNTIGLTGTITEIGTPPKVDDVSLTGDISESDIQSQWKQYIVLADGIHVYNSEYLVYGSECEYMPKLVEGVTYYAWSAFALCFGIIGFKLIDRIFRRIY